jgi:hypothetical protein
VIPCDQNEPPTRLQGETKVRKAMTETHQEGNQDRNSGRIEIVLNENTRNYETIKFIFL